MGDMTRSALQDLLAAQERALREGSARLEQALEDWRALVESAPDYIVKVDRNGTILFVNRFLEGVSPEQILGRSQFDLLTEKHRAVAKKAHESVFRDRVLAEYEVEWTAPDGRPRWFHVHAGPIVRDGEVVAAVLIANDITAKRQVEEVRSQLASIVESSDDAILRLDLDGTIVTWNAGAEALFGYTAREAIGRSALMLVPTELRELVSSNFEHLAKGGRQRAYETVRIRKDGQRIDVSIASAPLVDADGRVVGVSQITRDITTRKRAEAALHERERLFSTLARSARVGIYRTDAEGMVIYVNGRWVEIAGRPFNEAIGDGWLLAVHAEDRDRVREEWVRCVRQRLPFEAKFRFRQPDGRVAWALCEATEIAEAGATPLGYVGTVTDITRIHRAEEELRAANQELEQYAYVASHDLKAPLQAIEQLSQWIEEDLGDSLAEGPRTNLQLLRGRVRRLARLVDGLLLYARAARRTGTVENVDTRQLVEEIVQLLAPPSGFRVCVAEDLPVIRSWRTPLAQVFQNLIANALRHHHRKEGRIDVTARKEGTWIEFEVADDGPGISPAYHAKVFELFQTLHSKDVKEGSGIGLAIVRKVVESFGGVVSLASEEGRGARFRFTWPEMSTQE